MLKLDFTASIGGLGGREHRRPRFDSSRESEYVEFGFKPIAFPPSIHPKETVNRRRCQRRIPDLPSECVASIYTEFMIGRVGQKRSPLKIGNPSNLD